MDKYTEMGKEWAFEEYAYEDLLEGAKSTIPAGFDPAEHAKKLLNHGLFVSNHLSYGIKSAQKRMDKGTFDAEKNKKMGANLSKIGDFRLNTKLNAAQHRAVGEHLAKHIEDKIGYKGTQTESVKDACHAEPALPTGTADPKANQDNAKIKSAKKEPAPKASIQSLKNEGYDHDYDEDVPASSFNPKTDGKYKAKVAPKPSTVNRGTYGTSAGAEDSNAEAKPEKKNFSTANLPSWLSPKPVTSKAAKAVKQGVTTQQGKASDARAALSKELRAAKSPKEKAAIRAKYRSQLGEEVELDEVVGQTGAGMATRASMEKKGIQGVKAADFLAQLKDKTPAEKKAIMNARRDAIARVRKEGMMYEYEVGFLEGIVTTGKAVTENAAWIQVDRYINTMIETYLDMPEKANPSDVVTLGKLIAGNK